MNVTRRTAQCALKGLLLASALMVGGAASAAAGDTLAVSNFWIRALPGNLPSGGYFVATNSGDQAVDLVAVSTPAFGMAMLHQSQTQGGTSRMTMVDKVSVPAHGKLAFTPGDYHLMLEQPTQPVQIGAKLPMTFMFSGGQKIAAVCEVKNAGATGP